MTQPALHRIGLTTLSLVLLSACGGTTRTVNDQVFRAMNSNMTEAQVIQLVGAPDKKFQGEIDKLEWHTDGAKYVVCLNDGKVVSVYKRIAGASKAVPNIYLGPSK